MHPMLNIAVRAARKAGTIITRSMERVDTLSVTTKTRNDFVTEVDQRAEQEIIAVIKKAHPDHGFLAEESGAQGSGDYLWVIDPLDGTTNFLHGFPQFAVSIACQHKGRLEHAVVYDPVREELFTASRGAGAQLNGRRMRVSKAQQLEGSLIGTGFPFREITHMDAYMRMFRSLMPETAGIRRAGAATLDLAYVAAGRLDGFWEFGLKPWDMAAGVLLIQEAGGFVSDFTGSEDYVNSGNIVAGNAKILTQLIQKIKEFAV